MSSSERRSTAARRSVEQGPELGGVLGVGPGRGAARPWRSGRRPPRVASRSRAGGRPRPAAAAAAGVAASASARPSAVSKIASSRSTASVRCRCAEPLHRVVDGHLPGQAGGPLGGGHLEDAVRSRSSRTTIWLPAATSASPSIVNSPTRVLYRVSSFSPWKTRISAASWPSATVEKISVRVAGRGVFRSMIGAKQWIEGSPCSSPSASMPRVCGVMSTRTGPTSTPGDQAPLDGRPHRHGQVGLDLGVDRPAQPLLEQAVDQRGPGRPADQDHLVDLVGLELGVGQSAWSRQASVLASRGSISSSYSSPVDLHLEVEGHAVLLGDELLLDRGDGLGREPLLGVLDGAEDPAPGDRRSRGGRRRASRGTRRRRGRGAAGRSRRRRAGCRRGWRGSRRRPSSTWAIETSNVPPPRS